MSTLPKINLELENIEDSNNYIMGTNDNIKNLEKYYSKINDCECVYLNTESIDDIECDIFYLNIDYGEYFGLHYSKSFDIIKRKISPLSMGL